MKKDLKWLYSFSFALGFAVFLVSYFATWTLSLSPHPKSEVSPMDSAILTWCAAVLLQSLVLMGINNFIFIGQNKNWQDFWSRDMLEYFYTPAISEKWRIARGRFILFNLTLVSPFLVLFLYSALR